MQIAVTTRGFTGSIPFYQRACSPHDRQLLSPLLTNIAVASTHHHFPIRPACWRKKAMALVVNMVGARFSYSPSMENRLTKTESPRFLSPRTKRASAVVRAGANQAINPAIRKEEDKVVDSVLVAELSKPLTPYCR